MVVFGLPPLVLSLLSLLCVLILYYVPLPIGFAVCALLLRRDKLPAEAPTTLKGLAKALLWPTSTAWELAQVSRRRAGRAVAPRAPRPPRVYFAAAGAPAVLLLVVSRFGGGALGLARSPIVSLPFTAAAAARPRAEPLHRAHLRLARAAHNALVRLASYPRSTRGRAVARARLARPPLRLVPVGADRRRARRRTTMTGMSSDSGKTLLYVFDYRYRVYGIAHTNNQTRAAAPPIALLESSASPTAAPAKKAPAPCFRIWLGRRVISVGVSGAGTR